MTPKDPFLEGTFWDRFWRPIRSRALLFTPDKHFAIREKCSSNLARAFPRIVRKRLNLVLDGSVRAIRITTRSRTKSLANRIARFERSLQMFVFNSKDITAIRTDFGVAIRFVRVDFKSLRTDGGSNREPRTAIRDFLSSAGSIHDVM